jgi:ADP-dependent phosphofructokinase/glucokinase
MVRLVWELLMSNLKSHLSKQKASLFRQERAVLAPQTADQETLLSHPGDLIS